MLSILVGTGGEQPAVQCVSRGFKNRQVVHFFQNYFKPRNYSFVVAEIFKCKYQLLDTRLSDPTVNIISIAK
jgi:hypothetical protein